MPYCLKKEKKIQLLKKLQSTNTNKINKTIQCIPGKKPILISTSTPPMNLQDMLSTQKCDMPLFKGSKMPDTFSSFQNIKQKRCSSNQHHMKPQC